jgi:hypothetical protein
MANNALATLEDTLPVRTDKEVQLEERRFKVMRLRHVQKLSEPQIAQLLAVSQPTISRDLAWIAQHWRERYGVPAGVDPAHEIGEALAVFEESERNAMRDYGKVAKAVSQGSIEAVRIGVLCNRQAMEARQRRVNLLQDTGMLNRELGHVDVTGRVQADDVRGFLRSEGLLDPVKADDEVKTDEESVESWLEGDFEVDKSDV